MPISYSLRQSIKKILQQEQGTIRKVFGSCSSVALCFPNSYHIGASNLGFHFLYDRINSSDDFLAERFITDILPPVSLESQMPLNRFNLILFSIPFELDFASALQLLHDSHIPLKRKDRSPSDPLVLAGGMAVTMNPIPLSPFMDLLVLGDGEETLPFLLQSFVEAKGDKIACLKNLENHEGFFIPGPTWKEETPLPCRSVCRDLDQHPLASAFLSPDTEFSNTCLIEISRGCPYHCAFCYVGYNQNPFRLRSFASIRALVEKNRRRTNRFGFISSAVTAHPDLEELCRWCIEEELDVSFSSLRVDTLPPAVFELLKKSGQKTITLAPETGSEAFRKKIQKIISNEEILEGVRQTLKAGLRNIRLYFILGLPCEGQKEMEETGKLIHSIHGLMTENEKKTGKAGEITIGVSFFVPKPGTPLADFTMPPPEDLRRRQKILMAAIKHLSHVRIHPANPYEAIAQKILSLGGQETGDLLLEKIKGRLSWKTALKNWNI
jgi:radical SAM superfamily enzyme YgiQ (UPF0313 family)